MRMLDIGGFDMILALLDFQPPFTVETDTCNKGMGLSCNKIIAFISKAFGPKTQTLFVHEKELLAITVAVSKWRHYLEQGAFYIKTDQQSIKFLLEQRLHTHRKRKSLNCWVWIIR